MVRAPYTGCWGGGRGAFLEVQGPPSVPIPTHPRPPAQATSRSCLSSTGLPPYLVSTLHTDPEPHSIESTTRSRKSLAHLTALAPPPRHSSFPPEPCPNLGIPAMPLNFAPGSAPPLGPRGRGGDYVQSSTPWLRQPLSQRSSPTACPLPPTLSPNVLILQVPGVLLPSGHLACTDEPTGIFPLTLCAWGL